MRSIFLTAVICAMSFVTILVSEAQAYEITLTELASNNQGAGDSFGSGSFGDPASNDEMSDGEFVTGLGMVTGSQTGTYYRFGNDIKSAVQQDNINLIIKESKGSIDNIQRIDSRENAAFGIVQSDILGYLARSDSPKSKQAVQNLRMLFPFYQEEVHVVARENINVFSDLANKTVAIGQVGSGSWLTSVNILNITGVKPTKILRLSAEEGLVAVLSGKADAMIYVGGKPVKLFENLIELSKMDSYSSITDGIHLVPLDDDRFLKEYSAATIEPSDYSFVKEPVKTIAVTAIMVSYNFGVAEGPYSTARCQQIKDFSISLRKHLPELQKTGHPKWKEVNLDAEVGIWQRDDCAIVDSAAAAPSRDLELELLEIIKQSN